MHRRIALPATVALSVALAACASAGPAPTGIPPHPTGGGLRPIPSLAARPTPAKTGDGMIVGGLYRCFGLAPALSEPPTRVDGTVDVFRGPLPGLPDEIVPTDGTYSLELPPGAYDLVGHWEGSNLAPPMARVVVSSGTITPQDLVYTTCK
jgi:hypothetical protein